MPMNIIIQEKRKELGLTQEQVAAYLNVSTPAVSKWEKGITSPDISILPRLARLLKIDLNTLFCFQEDMTMEEVAYFCREITELIQTEGFVAGFKAASEKLREYPHNEMLLYYMAVQMDGHLLISGMKNEEKELYEAEILLWYKKLAESADGKISNSAKFMLAGRYIQTDEYEQAQEILDSMPDKDDIISSMADKLMLQVLIYQKQGQAEKAVKELQQALLIAVQKVQMLLNKLVDAELAAENLENAKLVAEKSAKMPALFDLWEYTSYVAPLQIATAEENADACVNVMRKLLSTVTEPWKMTESPLFYQIHESSNSANQEQMLQMLVSEMEKGKEYEFLRENEKYQELIDEYKEKMK